ncbi:hypothetical protein K2Y11_25110 [bacterium]|nr:hypothetical protein [bacterium]
MNACFAPPDSSLADSSNARFADAEILDPLTGELISIEEKDRLAQLHRRLENIALELLSTCCQIRAAIAPASGQLSDPSPWNGCT